MKWIIILLLFLVFIAVIAVRYRRQIIAGIEIWKMFRQVRKRMKPPAEKQIKPTATAAASKSNVELVRCGKCGRWVNESSALNLRSKTFYCSANCMEQAVRA